jgi:6-phosphogluconolactonase
MCAGHGMPCPYTMKMDIQVFPDVDAVSRAAFVELQRVMRDAIAERGRFTVALSGGHTPEKLYKLWAAAGEPTDWNLVHLFWGDERYVPKTDALSNYRMTRETHLLDAIPASNVHRMPGPEDFSTAQAAAEAYETELRGFFGSVPPAFDIQLLGLGVEGHTASLFPGSPALAEKQRWVMPVVAPAKPPDRLTLTPVVLNRGRNTYFLVGGADKREIISALRSEPDSKPIQYPAGLIKPGGRVLWFLDQAAAG